MSIVVTSTPNTVVQAPPKEGEAALQETVEEKSAAPTEGEAETQDASDASEEAVPELNAKDEHDAESSEGDEAKPKRKSGFQKRVDKLTRKLSEREREIEYWREQAMKGQPEPKKQASEMPMPEGRPKADDFEKHEDYVEALADWKVEQRFKAQEAKQKETQIKTEFQSVVEAHQKRVNTFAESHDDFEDVLEEVSDVDMSITVRDVILRSENGPELMYALAKDKAEYAKICKMSAVDAARAIGRFEAKIDAEKSKETTEVKKTTSAPPPIKTVGKGTGAGGRKSIYDPDISQAEYERLRREQMKRSSAWG
jgi:hypothetical protein